MRPQIQGRHPVPDVIECTVQSRVEVEPDFSIALGSNKTEPEDPGGRSEGQKMDTDGVWKVARRELTGLLVKLAQRFPLLPIPCVLRS